MDANTKSVEESETTNQGDDVEIKRYPTTIPWCGMYGTVMPEMLENALEQLLSDHDTGTKVDKEALEEATDAMDWHKAYTELAEEYTKQWAEWVGLDIKFVNMWSPREYNFVTDEIHTTISLDSLMAVRLDVMDSAIFKDVAKRRFTSRPGYISFYDSDTSTWGRNVLEWDVCQIGTLMSAAASKKYLSDKLSEESDDEDDVDFERNQMAQRELMEYPLGNGVIDNILFDNCLILAKLVEGIYEKSSQFPIDMGQLSLNLQPTSNQ